MRKFYYFFPLAAAAFLLLSTGLQAQPFVKQVVVVSGGDFSDPENYVRIGAYDPFEAEYTELDSIHARSANGIFIEKGMAYIAADSLLIKYDLDARKREGVATVQGIGKIAGYGDYLIVTRGYGATAGFVQMYKKSDLSLVRSIDAVSGQAAGVVVAGDTAYVTVPGAYPSDSGSIAIIDLKNMTLKQEVRLDTSGSAIGNIYASGDVVYAIAQTRSVVIEMSTKTRAVSMVNFPNWISISGGAGALHDTLFLTYNGQGLASYSLQAGTVIDSQLVNYNDIPAFSNFEQFLNATVLDTLNKVFYVSVTDYSSLGEVHIFDFKGNKKGMFEVGASPEVIAMDYRQDGSGIFARAQFSTLEIFPNPASSFIHISMENTPKAVIRIMDMSGRNIISQGYSAANAANATVDVSSLQQGVYIMQVISGNHIATARFVRN